MQLTDSKEMTKVRLSELITDYLSGNTDVYPEIYELTSGPAFRIAFAILKNQQDAEDVLQETYIKVFKNIKKLKDPAKFSSWFTSILKNTCKTLYKKTSDYKGRVTYNEYADQIIYNTVDDTLNLKPGHDVEVRQSNELLFQIIDGLPDMQSETIRLFYYEGRSTKEIAEIMDVSENTVSSRKYQAVGKLLNTVVEYQNKGMLVVVPLPLISVVTAQVWSGISANVAAVAAGSTASAGTGGIIAKVSALSTTTKIVIAGVGAGAVVITAAAINIESPQPEPPIEVNEVEVSGFWDSEDSNESQELVPVFTPIYQNADDHLDFLGRLYDAFSEEHFDKVLDLILTDEYSAICENVDVQNTVLYIPDEYAGLGIYSTLEDLAVQEAPTKCFIYYGNYDETTRSGQGSWIGISDNDSYNLLNLTWENDKPNGYGVLYGGSINKDSPFLGKLEFYVVDGFYEGEVFIYSKFTDEEELTLRTTAFYEKGVQQFSINAENGEVIETAEYSIPNGVIGFRYTDEMDENE